MATVSVEILPVESAEVDLDTPDSLGEREADPEAGDVIRTPFQRP